MNVPFYYQTSIQLSELAVICPALTIYEFDCFSILRVQSPVVLLILCIIKLPRGLKTSQRRVCRLSSQLAWASLK